jgi:site-specific DNA-methyltransferase (adenine-specific)
VTDSQTRHCDNLDPVFGLQSLDANSVDAIVTDPPAGIGFMTRAWDSDKGGRAKWVGWMTLVMDQCMRVLRPGGHMFTWALPRRSHWTALAIEDAGFEIDDIVHHLFGTGRPRSKRALKSAAEHWILSRKPGGKPILYVDVCRTGNGDGIRGARGSRRSGGIMGVSSPREKPWKPKPGVGRWPAHVVLDDSIVEEINAQAASDVARYFYCPKPSVAEKTVDDSIDNDHETVKSIALMQWLCRLITPPRGLVVDPFAGSGTTGIACVAEGFRYLGFETERRHVDTATQRIRSAL